ncbi:hypothetical protein DL765_009545 [Monosporascus sp. GIB2]|nr:hypothetical protein DL765_009545 [Monosporascus sp. GIB2]
MASGVEPIRQAAARVNTSLMDYIVSLTDETESQQSQPPSRVQTSLNTERPDGTSSTRASLSSARDVDLRSPTPAQPLSFPTQVPSEHSAADLDYAAAVNSLTLLFLNDHEETRVAALTWLIMLHRKAPRKIVAFNDGTFPALLKTLSDPAEAVVTKDLQLLSQISKNSEDDYFSNFMLSLLQLFSTDRRLLETRGNLIIRQLCMSLSPERIYRTLAETIEKEEDLEFASIMVQNLNNNLITAPELADLRKRLRNLETKDGQVFFVALFRSWCYNAVATFSLCLLAQAYEAAYHLLQIFAELEMTVNILIQIDKLVQLIESPPDLRLQLLEPENSVTAPAASNYDRPNRLGVKGREESIIRWDQLLEKFRSVQDKARRAQRLMSGGSPDDVPDLSGLRLADGAADAGGKEPPSRAATGPPVPQKEAAPQPAAAQKRSTGLGRQFGRLGGAVSGRNRRSQG